MLRNPVGECSIDSWFFDSPRGIDKRFEIDYPVRMSTGLPKSNIAKMRNVSTGEARVLRRQGRFAALARLGEVVFHTNDLANLWHIANKNTLYTALKRYVSQGFLFRIHKGFYAVKPLSELDPLLVGLKALHGYAYVSAETVLAKEGIIQQAVPNVTMVSKETRRFSIGAQQYYARKLADKFLYQPAGIITKENGVRKATRERAVADLLYFNRRAHFDGNHLIDWDRVRIIQAEIGYPLTYERHA